VKPQYANAILDGTKTVELRRTRPNLPDGSLVILYSSTPTRAVVGWAHLTGVREGTPIEIWDNYGAAAAIEEPDYDAYFDGTDQAFALELEDVVAAVQPIPLEVIRSIGIQPPQSWRYVPADVTTRIQACALA
jgi:predicted transcriptional regulator